MTLTVASSTLDRAAPRRRFGGIDHLEWWVGNARHSAGVLRDRPSASTSSPTPGPRPVRRTRCSYLLAAGRHPLHGVERRSTASPTRRPRAAPRRRRPRHRVPRRRLPTPRTTRSRSRRGRRAHAAPTTRRRRRHASSRRDRDLRRHRAHAPRPRRLPRPVRAAVRADRHRSLPVGPDGRHHALDHVVGNVEPGHLDDAGSTSTSSVFGFGQLTHFDDDQISTEYSALESTRGVGRRPGRDADQRARRRPAQEPDRGVPRLLRLARRAAHRPAHRRHRRRGRRAAGARRRGSWTCRPTYYDEARERLGELELPWDALERARRSSSTATTTATCSRSSPRTSPTGRPCSSRSSSASVRAGFGEGNFKALFEAIERGAGAPRQPVTRVMPRARAQSGAELLSTTRFVIEPSRSTESVTTSSGASHGNCFGSVHERELEDAAGAARCPSR